MKKMISVIKRMISNENVVAVYTVLSLLVMMLVASSENIPMIIVAVVNLWIAVRQLNKLEDKRVP